MLSERYNRNNLNEVFKSNINFYPFPDISERKKWKEIPLSLRDELVNEGEKYIGFEWPVLKASSYMDFMRDGNRTRYEEIYFKRRYAVSALVMAECIENKGRFLNDIIDGMWCICEESSWVLPAHNSPHMLPDVTKPYIDLFAAETGALVSWTYYLLKKLLNDISPIISERIEWEIKKRILDPYLEHDDMWWMALTEYGRCMVNNWNPWCNSNCLAAFLILEKDEKRYIQAVDKAMRSIDEFINSYHDDGGCNEGAGYWEHAGGSLFDCLELLYFASEGRVDVFQEPKIKAIGNFIYKAHISGDYFVNFADGSAKVTIPSDLVFRYGRRIGDSKLMSLGAYAYRTSINDSGRLRSYSLFRVLSAVFNRVCIDECMFPAPFTRDIWLKDLQFMTARETEGSDKGFFLAAKGGHNAESHNHNDVGQFIIYYNGKPVIIDVGVESYTAKTFSPHRYEIWTMQSAYHNIPTVNGVQQKDGRTYSSSNVSYSVDDGHAQLEMDIAGAYPVNAGIKHWKRTFVLNRKESAYIEVTDDFNLRCESSNIEFNFMTSCEIDTEKGKIVFHTSSGEILCMMFDSTYFTTHFEKIDIRDAQLTKVWGDHIYRIILKLRTPLKECVCKFIFISNLSSPASL